MKNKPKAPVKKPSKVQGKDTLSVLGIPFGKIPKNIATKTISRSW